MSNPRSHLMLTTALRAPEGTDAVAVVAPVDAAAPVAESPAGAAPAVISSPTDNGAGPAAGEPAPTETIDAAKPAEGEAAPAKEAAGPKTSLLTEAAKAEAKPEETKPSDAAPVVEKPVYEAFTMPEGVTADGDLMSKFTDMLGTSKLSQEQGQAFVDMFGSAVKAHADHAAQEQWRVWNETNDKWVGEIKSDKEFGGAKFDTSTKAAMRMVDLLIKKDERADFNQFMDTTGAGNNPWMFKMLNRVAQWLDEPVMPKPPTKPAKGNGKAPGARGLRSMYKDAAN